MRQRNDAKSTATRRRLMRQWQAEARPCIRCGQPIDYTLDGRTPEGPTLDHLDPVTHYGLDGHTDDRLAPAHHHCNSRHGRRLQAQRDKRAGQKQFPHSGSTTPAPYSRSFTQGKRLTGQEPAGVPLHFPDPHPNRVDSLVSDLGDYAKRVHGVELRPWQWVVADRLLEVDGQGRFCWSGGLMVVMPRQLGKSLLLSMLALWSAHERRAVVVSTADTLRTVDRVQVLWRRWAKEQGYRVTGRLDQPEVDFGHGGRWIGQAANDHLGVGVTVDVGLVDEAWDVPEVAVTRALTPAMSAVESPLLLLTSTASVGESALMDRYRDAAEQGVANVGLVEWAAPADADWRDEETWRAAHPYWTPQRLAYLRQQVAVVPPEDFQSQYLCIAQARRRRLDTAPLIAPEVLAPLRRPGMQPAGHVVGAVECWYGEQSGAALAWRHPESGEVCVVGRRFDRIEQAFQWVGTYANETLVGLMWREHPGAQMLGAKGVGTRETVKALPLLRKLAADGRLYWDGDDLADQLTPLHVVEKDGVLKISGGQHWIARPAAWAVWQQETQPALAPNIY